MPSYPPFSGVRARCPKCATVAAHFVQHFQDTTAEYMSRRCGTCSYTWRELVVDAPETTDKPRTSAAPDFWSLLGLVDVDKVVDSFLNSLKDKK